MKNTFELEHVGINTDNEEEAMKVANLISTMLNMKVAPGTDRSPSLPATISSA